MLSLPELMFYRHMASLDHKERSFFKWFAFVVACTNEVTIFRHMFWCIGRVEMHFLLKKQFLLKPIHSHINSHTDWESDPCRLWYISKLNRLSRANRFKIGKTDFFYFVKSATLRGDRPRVEVVTMPRLTMPRSNWIVRELLNYQCNYRYETAVRSVWSC